MDVNDVLPIETKDLDITRFFKDQSKKVVIQIRHYTYGEKMKLAQMISSEDPGKVKVENLKDVIYAELLYGVVKETSPFGGWDSFLIEELDKRNPELIEFIHTAVREYNSPLAEKNVGK
ncbi:MAG: hypothetical protein ACTSPV_00800 [Candidatus Hodarchaeales archaeon]